MNHESSGVVVFERFGNVLHQRIQERDDPAVDFGTLLHRNLLFTAREAVHVGVEGEERVGVVERSEEFAAHFVDAVPVELEVVPRLRVGDHVPARRVGSVGVEHLERIDGVAQAFRHLVAVLVQHQTVRNDILESHRVEEHRGDGVQREEPAARLVDTLGDEVGGVDLAEALLVLERVVHLRIGHGARVEPHVDQVRFAPHRLALRRDQHDRIDIGAVQVDVLGRVVLLRHVADPEIPVRVFLHDARRYRTLYFGHQLFDRTDALHLGVVLRGPYGQRGSPEARTREVPVHQSFEPLAEAARSGRFGFPADRFVQFDHPLAQRRGADEPRVERVVEHGFVRAPAVGVGVGVLLDLEGLVFGFQHHRDVDVQRRVGLAQPLVVGVLHVAARILPVFRGVDVRLHELRVELFDQKEFALPVDHRLVLARAVDHEERRDAGGLGHAVVVGAERRGDVHDARTVRGGHVVADDHAEGVAFRLHPRDQLLVADAFQLGTFPAPLHDLVCAFHLLGEVGTQ